MPTHVHDCDQGCIYLGSERSGEFLDLLDLWVHFRQDLESDHADLIRRWGSDGPEYGCMSVHRDDPCPSPLYVKAYELAHAIWPKEVI